MIVLVTGGRRYNNGNKMYSALDAIHKEDEIGIVVQGGADGADRLARKWAESRGIHFATVEPLWKCNDKSAGNIRNGAMLILKPDLVVAAPGQSGTADMIKQAKNAGVKIHEII